MPSRRQASYRWALHPEASTLAPSALSEAALAGLEYAEQMARDAGQRSRAVLRNQPPLAPLTLEQLAVDAGIQPAVVRARITRARRELFGELTDSAIDKRVDRQRHLRRRRLTLPSCAQQGCPNRLPARARSNRRYCDQHAQPRERTRRHRTSRITAP